MRYAIYFTPPPDDPLTRIAANWLGRDGFSGETVLPPPLGGLDPAEIAFHTASARRYGFHATLMAPFSLAPGEGEQALLRAFAAFCEASRPFDLSRLKLAQIDGFFALVPDGDVRRLNEFAGEVVLAFDRFRAPLSTGEITRRHPGSLKPAELRNLHQWGYPFVFDTFRFHMTLTGRASGQEAQRLERVLSDWFAPVLDAPVGISALTLFVEPEPGAPFIVYRQAGLGQTPERLRA
ncbi:MAG: DUF1045 domain-containing protein [Notoacmeibacter sp.]|nr:DUF1045 domain-containing protein [Notoacmeibacter sp.]